MSYLIAFGVNNDFGLANKADNPHLPVPHEKSAVLASCTYT